MITINGKANKGFGEYFVSYDAIQGTKDIQDILSEMIDSFKRIFWKTLAIERNKVTRINICVDFESQSIYKEIEVNTDMASTTEEKIDQELHEKVIQVAQEITDRLAFILITSGGFYHMNNKEN